MFNSYIIFWDYCMYTALISPFFLFRIFNFGLKVYWGFECIVYFCKIDVFRKSDASYD